MSAERESTLSPARLLPPAPLPASPTLPDPADSEECADGRAKLVAALHGTLLMTHVNAAGKQAVAVDTLLKLVQNVLREPWAEKFRRVRCSNEAIKTKLLGVKGCEEFLRAAGFKSVTLEFERYLLLEAGFNADLLRVAERLLLKVQVAVTEKAERHERDAWLAKNSDRLAREQALAALAADKEARREKAEREEATKAALAATPAATQQ